MNETFDLIVKSFAIVVVAFGLILLSAGAITIGNYLWPETGGFIVIMLMAIWAAEKLVDWWMASD